MTFHDDCELTISLFKNEDDVNAMNMFSNVLKTYHTKYAINDMDLFFKEFRADTTYIFHIFQIIFASDKMITDFPKEFDMTDENDKQELYEYYDVVSNIQFILANIDTVDLLHPDEEFTHNCNNAIAYFNKKQNEMEGLTNTISKFVQTLESFGNAPK